MASTFVLGYDGSDCSKVALQRTAELASQMKDAKVVVVYAYEFSIGYVPTGMADSPLLMSAEFDEHSDLVRGYADEQVKQAAQSLAKAGVAVETRVEEGRPVEVLLQAAKDAGASLLVVGSHGEGGLSAAFMGSTALKLLHHSELPVLVVPRHKG
jgi:nucleotide-binding universal stress UspA family protein